MEKELRLRKNRDFAKVYSKGKKYWNRNFTMIVKKNGLKQTRVGFSISRKFGKAVDRNHIKRILKEIVRRLKDQMDQGIDIVIIPKKNTSTMRYEELEKSIKHIFSLAFKKDPSNE